MMINFGKIMAVAIDIAMIYGTSQGALAKTQVALAPNLDPWVAATPQHILNGQVCARFDDHIKNKARYLPSSGK